MEKNISIVGIGVGGCANLTVQAIDIIKEADFVIGAGRMLDILSELQVDVPSVSAILDRDIFAEIEKCSVENIVILMSGDTGFHSGCTKLIDVINKTSCAVDYDNGDDYYVSVYSGISSVQYMASKIKLPWQNVHLASAHGVDCNYVGKVLKYPETFFLLGGKITASVLINGLIDAGFRDFTVYIGENLGYPDEKITKLLVTDNFNIDVAKLSVLWIKRVPITIDKYTGSFPDEVFIRGKVPMTKEVVRNQIVSLIGRNMENHIIYDVGAGTGSVAIELALNNPLSTVYAFENNPEAVELIKTNVECFYVYNLIIIEGTAPDTFAELPAPDDVFVGGSKGNMQEIIDTILKLNPHCDFVFSAIAIETITKITSIYDEKCKPYNLTQISVSKNKKAGNYNLLTAENPTILIHGQLQE